MPRERAITIDFRSPKTTLTGHSTTRGATDTRTAPRDSPRPRPHREYPSAELLPRPFPPHFKLFGFLFPGFFSSFLMRMSSTGIGARVHLQLTPPPTHRRTRDSVTPNEQGGNHINHHGAISADLPPLETRAPVTGHPDPLTPVLNSDWSDGETATAISRQTPTHVDPTAHIGATAGSHLTSFRHRHKKMD